MATKLNVRLIKNLRAHFRMTKGDLALNAGTHLRTIQNIEAGNVCSLHVINKIATVFHCAPKQLLTDEAQPPKNYVLVENMR